MLSEDKDLEENVVHSCRESNINVSGVENVEVGEAIDIGWFSFFREVVESYRICYEICQKL